MDSFLEPSKHFAASSTSATKNANQGTTLEQEQQNIDDSKQDHEGEDDLLIE